jgi:DNA-binding MarR family transcriptional regulator
MESECDHKVSINIEEVLKIENQLCFPLYACAKEIVKKYKPYLDEIELTYTQYITMMIMWEKKEINVKMLGEYLYLDSGTLTPVLKKLELKEYVRRERSKEDERNLIITITDKGEELKAKACHIPEKIGGVLDITSEEAAILYRTLYKLLGQIAE